LGLPENGKYPTLRLFLSSMTISLEFEADISQISTDVLISHYL
jgi:hypothetical protein